MKRNYNSTYEIERRQLEALDIREQAWGEVQPLIKRGAVAEAVQRMKRACRKAYELEQA